MAIPLESLPPKVREQVAGKMMKELRQKPQGKYGNQKEVRQVNGNEIIFDSRKEARRYDELYLLWKAGRIREFKLQPEFTISEAYTTPEGVKVRPIKYRADFSYEEQVGEHWRKVVEDVKSEATKTRVYEIKKKLLMERLGIIIKEI